MEDPSVRSITPGSGDNAEPGSRKHSRRDVGIRYHELFTAATVGLYWSSPDGQIREANPAFVDLLGYPDFEALHGVNAKELYVDGAVRREIVDRLEYDGAVMGAEAAMRRHDGTVIWVRSSIHLVRTADGTPSHLEGAVVDITDRIRAEDEARRQATRFETLNAVIAAAAQATDLQALFESTIDRTINLLGGDSGAIYTETMSVLRGLPREVDAMLLKTQQPTGEDPCGVQAVNDWAEHPSASASPLMTATHRAGFRASLRAPILVDDRAIGGITIFSAVPRVWAPEELQLVDAIGRQIGPMVHRLQLLETTLRTAELEAFSDLSRRLREARSEPEMYPIIVDRARELLNADQGGLAFAAPDRETLTVVHTVGVEKEPPEGVLSAQDSRSGLVLRTGATFVTSDNSAETSAGPTDGPPHHLAGPLAVAPVRSQDGVIGTLTMGRRQRPGVQPFSDAEVRLLEELAEIAGTGITRARLQNHLEHAYIEMVLTLARAVDARDSYSSNHSEQIAARAVRLARALGCAEPEVQDVHWAALLHDIGKLGVSDSILRKPGPLDAGEWEIMRQHPAVGAEILRPVERMETVARLVRHHQERWDGTGYPDGLQGDAIPLGARILAVVDAFITILDNRAYTRGRSPDEALTELRRCAGAQFDPMVVDTFCRVALDEDTEVPTLERAPREGTGIPSPAASIARSLSYARRAVPALTYLAKHLLRPLDLATVLDEVLQQIQEVFGYPMCGVFFIDEATEELYVMAQRGFAPEVSHWRFPVGKRGVVGWVARHRRAYYAPDVSRDPYYVVASLMTRSNAAFPLLVDDRILGVLNVECPLIDGFPQESREFLEAFAVLAALAIQRAQRDDDLNRLARTDGLTGLANRRALWDALQREIARARRLNTPVSVVVVEVDNFKRCNDVLGHLEGDRVLQAVADALRMSTRDMDLVARFGGDEFVLLLPGTNTAAACQIAERVRASVERLAFPRVPRITVSIGLASMPEHGSTAEALVEVADQHMYEAKRAGGNCLGAI